MTELKDRWTCPVCDITHWAAFDSCWNCGGDRKGIPDPEFEIEFVEESEDEAPLRFDEPKKGHFQFKTWHLMLATLVVAICLVVGRLSPTWLGLIVIAAVINVIGLGIGFVVTYVFRLPNDGSRTWSDEKREFPDSRR